MTRGHRSRCGFAGRRRIHLPTPQARPPTSARTRIGGTALSSTAAIGFSPTPCAPAGGRLRLDRLGLPPEDVEKIASQSETAANFWVGLAILHSLFMREHNTICDHLGTAHPDMSDQQLYDTARLVNTAVMAKIHTVDWTPAIIGHPTTVYAMHANWFGLFGERVAEFLRRGTRNALICGIPGSPTNLHDVPYSLTEEFVAVYRMHPLIPDDFVFRSPPTIL
nr:peroxidase family protein [Mycobacteroides abscessus]